MSEEELVELNEKMALTNQMLYNAQNQASAKDFEIEDFKAKLISLTEETEGLKRDLQQSQTDKTRQTNEFEETLVSLESQVADLKKKNDHWQEQWENQARYLEEKREEHAEQSQVEQEHQKATDMLIRKYEGNYNIILTRAFWRIFLVMLFEIANISISDSAEWACWLRLSHDDFTNFSDLVVLF